MSRQSLVGSIRCIEWIDMKLPGFKTHSKLCLHIESGNEEGEHSTG